MGSNLKKLVRARMAETGESYVTALMRVRECTPSPSPDLAEKVAETIRQSPPRQGGPTQTKGPR
jgi:hypothetical protein